MQYNMSPETIIDGKLTSLTVDQILDIGYGQGKDWIGLPDNECVSATGQHFRIDRDGIFPKIVEDMYARRVTVKKLMLKVLWVHTIEL